MPTADDLQLHHTITGSGPSVVFTHGWLNTGDVWNGTVEALDGSARALTWDLRGHGSSGTAEPGEYERAIALDDLSRMVKAVGEPAVLVGHSLGGYMALAYAIERPADVAGLVLVAAGPGFRSMKSLEQWNASVEATAAEADIPDGQQRISMHVDSMVMDRLGEITVPVVSVCGERDKRFIASMDIFDKHLDVKDRLIVPDAGHMVHVKQPQAVAGAISTLLTHL